MKLLFPKLTLLMALISTGLLTKAQMPAGWALDGSTYRDTSNATPAQMARIHKSQKIAILKNDHFYIERNLGVRFVNADDSKNVIYEGTYPFAGGNSILIDGNCSVELLAVDVTEKNAASFRYHVVQNDIREIVPWSTPTVFKYTADGKAKYAWLGKFKYVPGQVLKVEISNMNSYRHRDATTIDWRKVEPAKLLGFIDYYSAKTHPRDHGFYSRYLKDTAKTIEGYGTRINGKFKALQRPRSVKDYIETTDTSDIRFRADDSVQNLTFFVTNGGRTYNYNMSLISSTDSIYLGENHGKLALNKVFWKTPGKYKIVFTPKIHTHGGKKVYVLHNLSSSFSFTVLPPLNGLYNVPLKTVIAIVLGIILVVGIYIDWYRSKQKRQLAQSAQQRQVATLQLQAVRSQLNPHFIFNALAGIQNLINKNAIDDANKYLTRFARITRNVLDDGQKELISIEQETNLLTDYLQMEQTRFGFKYNITVADGIDQQIEIPAMLLQPFVENAIKHGISALKADGLVSINIAKNNNDLILTVQDNGKGFDSYKTGGLGIKLCRERIDLFNSIYKNTTILLAIQPDDKGTLITIQLRNWL